jgi:endonuclease-8
MIRTNDFEGSKIVPEGDTIFRAARTLHRYMAGDVVTRFESMYPALNRIAEDQPIVGRTIESVSARGKHLLFTFSGGLTLRTHLRMNGSWHIYPAGAPWRRPAREMRVLVCTAKACAVGFNIPVAELLTAADLQRHAQLQALGPDLLGEAFDHEEAVRRMRARAADPIAEVLLNQRVMAGIGNVFKSEVLFLAGVHPFAPTASLTDAELRQIVDIAREQLAVNVMAQSQTLSLATGRRTTRSLNPKENLWVYSRGGRPCRRCSTPIQSKKTGPDARGTYWCPSCQARPRIS